jgi:UDP-N-acetyl-D-glucosamine dehydrogenase
MSVTICVVGQGYVGLPMSLEAAKSGFKVIGIDINQSIVQNLNLGVSHVEDVSNLEISEMLMSGNLNVVNDFQLVKNASIVLICVPTPLTLQKKPDLSYLVDAVTSVSRNMNSKTLVIVESTVEPGTTRNLLLPIIKKESKLMEQDFYLAFSPERVDPRNKEWHLVNTPKLVSGLNEISLLKAVDFYSKFANSVIQCESLEIAETAKLLENSFRLINISFINEIAILCHKLGIDVNKVIDAAGTKPYGFMSFYPSVGIGGHCIPVDPLYLSNKARELSAPTMMIELASKINDGLPDYFVERAEELIGSLEFKKILIVGVAYKPNISDSRETPAIGLVNTLKSKGAEVFWHDDLVIEWNGEKSVALSSEYDLAILATPHAYLDLTKLGSVPILNTRGSI